MPTEFVVALIFAMGGIVTAIIAGTFSIITARSGKALSGNTTEIASISAQALALVDHYKAIAEQAERKLAARDRTIATQRETIGTLVERQDVLRRAAEGK